MMTTMMHTPTPDDKGVAETCRNHPSGLHAPAPRRGRGCPSGLDGAARQASLFLRIPDVSAWWTRSTHASGAPPPVPPARTRSHVHLHYTRAHTPVRRRRGRGLTAATGAPPWPPGKGEVRALNARACGRPRRARHSAQAGGSPPMTEAASKAEAGSGPSISPTSAEHTVPGPSVLSVTGNGARTVSPASPRAAGGIVAAPPQRSPGIRTDERVIAAELRVHTAFPGSPLPGQVADPCLLLCEGGPVCEGGTRHTARGPARPPRCRPCSRDGCAPNTAAIS